MAYLSDANADVHQAMAKVFGSKHRIFVGENFQMLTICATKLNYSMKNRAKPKKNN